MPQYGLSLIRIFLNMDKIVSSFSRFRTESEVFPYFGIFHAVYVTVTSEFENSYKVIYSIFIYKAF